MKSAARLILPLLLVSALALPAPILAEEPPEPAMDYQAQLEAWNDAFYASYGPMRYQPAMADRFISQDTRFKATIDRMAAMDMAIPGVREAYDTAVSKNRFVGSFADYGRNNAVYKLSEPRYGRHAAILDEYNPELWTVYLGAWKEADAARAKSGGALLPCTPGSRISALSLEEVARALSAYAGPLADLAGLNRDAQRLFMGSLADDAQVIYDPAIIRSWATSWLVNGYEGDVLSPECPFANTPLESLVEQNSDVISGLFSPAVAPE